MWKKAKNWEDLYEVSIYGEVRNIKNKNIIKGDINSTGYRRVQMCRDGKVKKVFVHRLVAETFLNNYCEDLIVNHKDGNKLNNNISNLEWITRSENNIHAYKNNLTQYEYNGEFKIEFLDNTVYTYNSFRECERLTGINKTSLRNWVNGKSKNPKYEKYNIKNIYYCGK